MNKKISSLTGIIVVLALAAALGAVIFAFGLSFPKDNNFDINGLKIIKKGIMVSLPRPGDKIASPVKIKGYVNGDGWIGFEGQAGTVALFDDAGVQLGEAVLAATTDWTKPPVEFEVNLEFNKTNQSKGTLIFKNENPSGLEENNRELKVPVLISSTNAETMKLSVYFNNNNLDPEISCNKVFPAEREVPKTLSVARAAVEELLKGPSENEKQSGFFTSINTGVKIQKLTIENGIAKVDFDGQLENGVGGSCKVSAIRAQITQTLKQFQTVTGVIISINGRTEDILQP
ncbi:MAG: GerMN domain-containing protein [Candidatus Nealsonbacteria bacterium]|nr:GerMN domain-containing protein [Candidatus Nealsonbacteria bacterium]